MKKLALAVLLSTMGVAQAQTAVDLAGGRLLFQGRLNMSGCTIDGAIGALGDMTVMMPGSLGVDKVEPLAAATVDAFERLKKETKYKSGSGSLPISVNCPTDDVYVYIADLVGPPADQDTVEADFKAKTKMYFYGAGNGASGFTKGPNAIGVLAADDSSPNKSVGIAIKHLNPQGVDTDVLVNLNDTLSVDGVPVQLFWTSPAANVINATPEFQFAYVPASSTDPVIGGVTTATLPFKVIYK